MTDTWETIKASEVQIGDRIRVRGNELVASRIESNFLDRENFFGFIEDTPERWFKQPAAGDLDVEVLRQSNM
jgi:hypothetical protein